MGERFFLRAEPHDATAILTGDEARHLTRVMRARIGDEVSVFDGAGREWPGRVARIARDRVELSLGPVRTDPAPPVRVLAVALPKGDRQKWLVEKLTELGVTRLVPLIAGRGVAEPTEAARERLERTAIEACKQCGRTTLLEIAAAATPEALVAGTIPAGPGLGAAAAPRLVLADARGGSWREVGAGIASPVGLVGPEGGFTPGELALFSRAGAVPVRLGPHVLRVETAAIALAALLGSG